MPLIRRLAFFLDFEMIALRCLDARWQLGAIEERADTPPFPRDLAGETASQQKRASFFFFFSREAKRTNEPNLG